MKARLSAVAALLVIAASGAAFAGGPHAVNGAGQPMVWSTAGPVTYNPENGALGLLTNAQARSLLAQAFAEWEAGPATITFTEGSLLGVDVNATGIPLTNPAHYQNFYRKSGDSKTPVIFDNDGSIIDGIFGTGARFDILGVAGLDTPVGVSTTITEASIVINGLFYDGVGLPSSPTDETLTGLKAAMVHEIGHAINLDHTYLNHELALDGNAGNDIYVPTMFPIAADDEAALATTNPDDQLAAENLYPPGAGTNGLSGSVTASGVPFQGANVVFRKIGDPLMTAYSLISGNRFFPCNPGSSCDPCTTACNPGNPAIQGSFAADFFATGSYKISVEQIDRRFTAQSGTFVGPLATPALLTGPEEYYDASESGSASDDPDDFTAVAAGSGTPVNIALDTLPASDAFEPNNSFATASVMDDLPTGSDTAPATLDASDVDVYQVPVVAGQRVRIDIDAKELGSSVDTVVGFYNASNVLVALVDDAVDPDTGEFSLDPATEIVANFTGTAKIKVSSYPDLDQDGVGGGSTGGYWLRVEVATDTDGDGAPDAEDICPTTAKDDADRDGVCFGTDNCPTDYNPTQDAPVKISGTITANGDVSFFAITPDDARVVFVADSDNDDVFELYSVPLDGSAAPVKLNPSFGATLKDVTGFRFAPDSSRVVYLADQDTDDVFELYSVPIAGGAVTKISGSMVSGGDVKEFAVSPNSARVVFRADRVTDNVDELFSVPIAGTTPDQLSGTMIAGGSIIDPGSLSSFLISSDSAYVVYDADQSTNDVFELYSVPLAGPSSSGVKLNAAFVTGGDIQRFNVSPNGARVVYVADQELDGANEIYSVPIAGGTVTKLSGTLPPTATGWQRFAISQDSATVVYTMDQDTAAVFELYSVPIAGGTRTKLSGTLVSGGDVFGIALPVGPLDGNRMTFRADKDVDNKTEFYSVPITGGTVVKLNTALPAGGNVTAQGGGIYKSIALYIADQVVDEKFEAYSVALDGLTPPVKISGTMQASGDVQNAGFDANRIAVFADKDTDGVNEIYGVRLAGGSPVKLNAPLVAGGNVVDWNITNADAPGRIAYMADQDTDEKFELYSRTFSMDAEGDGVFDRCDLCPDASDPSQADADGNGVGDACQGCAVGTDPDNDGVCNAADNCPAVANVGQADFDGDGAGDACDDDDDDDGLLDTVETNTGTYVSPTNTGSNPFDSDSDNDGVTDGVEVANGTNPNNPAATLPEIPFLAGRSITTGADGVWAVATADLDGDGDLDVLSASQADDTIGWSENLDGKGTFGSRQTISAAVDGARSVAAADLDRDGDLDVLSASYAGATVAWHENVNGQGTSWTAHTISANANGAACVATADLDGDGDQDVLIAETLGDRLTWHENRLDEVSADFGPAQVLASGGSVSPIWVVAADVDGDGDLDVLSAWLDSTVAWHENLDGAGNFGPQQLISTAGEGADCVAPADVDGDGDLDVFVSSYLDHEVAWYENTDGFGSFNAAPNFIATGGSAAVGAETVFAADIDADGDPDVLVASYLDDTVGWYENLDGAGVFGPRHVLTSTAVTAVHAVAADVDGDGDIDAISASFGNDTVAWYENRTIHRNADLATHHVISSAVAGPVSVDSGDIDGDGNIDTMHADGQTDTIRWFASDGATPPAWAAHTVVALPGAGLEYAELKDLDRDGDLDVLLAAGVGDVVAWYESGGGAVPSWTSHTISTSQDGPLYATAGDLDGDGDLDVVASSFNDRKLSWYRNDGAHPPGFTEFVISTSGPGLNRRGLAIADVDRDGDMDIVAAVPNLGVHWYANDGAATPGWTERVISDSFGLTSYVDVADINGDGDLDVVATEYTGNRIGWFENDGLAVPGWTIRAVTMPDNQWVMAYARDLDRDGDIDIVATSGGKGFVWLENDGGDLPSWTARTISFGPVGDPLSVGVFKPGDLDSDGDLDMVIGAFSSGTGHKHEWWENSGGQFSLSTISLAPATIGNGATVPMLAIDLTSNARAGDSDIELASLALRVTDGAGVSLATDEANRLIQRVRVYLDNGSSSFELGLDTLVASVDELALAPLAIPFTAGDPRVRLTAGQSKRLFVVLETTVDASSQSPNAFKITHDTAAGTSARNAATGAVLAIQSPSSVATPTITTNGDVTPPFVTSVFPAAGSVDVTSNTNVVVIMSEPVNPATAPAGVSLSLAGIKLSGAVRVSSDGRVITFDPSAPLALGGTFQFKVESALKDRSGNGATAFTSSFEGASSAGSGTIDAGTLGNGSDGSLLEGANANDNSGFSAAALEDVNATTLSQGISDLIVGAPNADNGAVDAGEARLVFGAPGLQSNGGAVVGVKYRTGTAGDFVGDTVAPSGDMNHDGIKDFLIGAPRSDQSGTDAGAVYLVFGNAGIDELAPGPLNLNSLPACASPTLCGVRFLGAGSGDKAGTSLSRAGDVNADGFDDLLIGAPGADPAGRADAGVAYLIFGPLSPGTISLSSVGSSTPGLVLRGETAGDHLGASVSQWEDRNSDGIDDMLLGAPDATSRDEFGASIPTAGYVYAVQGGRGPRHLVDIATPGIIELSRVANGAADQVAGMVFLGATPNGALGRSLTGAVDTDGNGVDDILIAGNGVVFAIPGDGPKTVDGGTRTGGTVVAPPLTRTFGGLDAILDFGAARFVAPDSDPLTVGAAGDLNNDGVEDFIIGAPQADGPAGIDAGRAYVVLGSPAPAQAERSLSDVGGSIAGFVVEGAEAGDNLGASVGGGQDVNADGVSDGLVGAPFADTGTGTPANAGATYVISPLHPEDVQQLKVQIVGGTTRLEWTVTDLAANYNVYSGLLSTVRSNGGVRTSAMTHLACGTNLDVDADLLPDYDDVAVGPAVGEAFVYLVTARNVQGEGSIGSGTPTRSNDAQCP